MRRYLLRTLLLLPLAIGCAGGPEDGPNGETETNDLTSGFSSFGIELNGTSIRGIDTVSGLVVATQLIELKQTLPDGTFIIKKLPAGPLGGEIAFNRAIGPNDPQSLMTFATNLLVGRTPVGPVTVNLFTSTGQLARRYVVRDPVFKSLEIVNGPTKLSELLTIAHTGIMFGG